MNDGQLGSAVALAVGGIVLALGGLLMIWLARRSHSGRIPPNQLVGVRTALTLSSAEAWYPAQRASARSTAIGGAGAIISGILVTTVGFWGLGPDATFSLAAILTLGGAAWTIGWALAAAAAGQNAARAAVDPS